jgi:hypothetical protein
MSKGFDVIEPGTEDKLDWNDELQKASLDHYDEFLQAIYWQRRDGRALQSFMKKENELVNFAGAAGQYRLYKNALGKPTKGTFTPQIDGFPGTKTQKLKAEEDNFMELIVDRREKIAEGMSVLEPVWDVLFAIYMLVSHSAYFVARGGAGIKDISVDESVFTDTGSTDILTTLHTALAEFGSASDTIVRPKTLGGQAVDFEIKTIDSMIDFELILRLYLTIFSAHTGIPRSTLEGLVPGQLAGAIVNEASYFDFLFDLQKKYIRYCKWYVRQLIKFYKFTGTDKETEFEIQFKVREVISEQDKTVLMSSKLELAKKYKDLGLSTMKALEKAGVEGIEESDLREGIDEMPTFLKPTDEQDDSNDDEDKDTEDKDDEDDKK